jgi:MoaA/NifB/PqqE/SkfB family radical SAM enzyme
MNLLNETTHLDVYINLDCNLRCKHCFIGSELETKINFQLKSLYNLLEYSRDKGVNKLSLLGGEPSIYPHILDVLKKAELLNFKETRIITNGTKPLTNIIKTYSTAKSKPTIIFSLDSVNKTTHDKIRGYNSFEQLMYNIKLANEFDFKLAGITSINKYNQTEILEILDFAQHNNMKYLNFHLVNIRGFANNEIVVSPETWLNIREKVIDYSVNLNYPIKFDRKFIQLKELRNLPPYFDECFVNEENDGNVMVLPDGRVYKCALFIDENKMNSHFWTGDEIRKNLETNNEIDICSTKCSGQCPGLKLFSSNFCDENEYGTLCMYRKEIIKEGKVYLFENSLQLDETHS